VDTGFDTELGQSAARNVLAHTYGHEIDHERVS
jgi:hypothetical protein